MERTGMLQLALAPTTPAWWSLGLAALMVGLLLSCPRSTSMAAVNTSTPPLAQQPTQNPATSRARATNEPDGSQRAQRIKRRLLTVALTGAVLLLLLAFGYGYLRLELTTRGFYSGRLQIAAGIASIATVAAAYFLWRWLIVN